MLIDPADLDWNSAQPKLKEWYASFLGQSMLAEINFHLENVLRPVFGYQGLQLGQLGIEEGLLGNAELLRRFVLGANERQMQVDLSASVLELPIASDTISLLIMPHTLEFCRDPHQVLREADRVLSRNGYLLILGFNPISSWGLARSLRLWKRNTPWDGKFYTRARVNDWLSLLGFSVVDSRHFFLRPPFTHHGVLFRLSFLEKLQPWLNLLGGAYLVLARKQLRPLTPRLQRWRRRQTVVARHVTDPVGKIQDTQGTNG